MEKSSDRNSMQSVPHAAAHGSLPPEYWNNLSSMYPDQQLQSQPILQQDSAAQQQQHQEPMGIDWNHPVFQQHQPQHFQERSHLPPQADLNHGIYSSIPQSWQANPLQQPARGYQIPLQYQANQQTPLVTHDQRSFETHRPDPSESSAFPSYSYHPNYLQSPAPPVHDSVSGHPIQQHQQSAEITATGPRSSLPRPSGYPQDTLHTNTIDLTRDFPDPQSAVPQHQTIDPQYLNPLHGSTQTPTVLQNPMFYGGPNDYQVPDGRDFNYYENSFSVQPRTGATGNATETPHGVSSLTGLPQPQVVIPVRKGLVGQAPKKKSRSQVQKKPSGRSEDDSSGSDLEIEAPDEPSPLPPSRPSEPIAAAEYDTLKAVWSPRNKWPSADKVKSALVAFKDVIKALRDTWREHVQAMKLAENQGTNDKATVFKEQAALQRRVMDRIVVTTLNLGHPAIVEKLGEHPLALSVLHSFLVDRFQAADYDGSLTINILKLLARFVTVDDELLQKTNIAKLLPKFVKKGGRTVKDLAQTIQQNASSSTKRKQSNGNSPAKDDSPSAEVVGSKRAHDGESNAPPATKKMVVASNPKDSSKPSTTANGPTKAVVPNGKSANAAAARPKTNIVTPRPTSLFGALSSASKRPGTTNAERAAAAAAASKPTPPAEKEKPAAPPPKPAFSFGDIMADLSKPKEEVVAKPTEDNATETEEERAKRLRKESRRKLRVTWKPEESLTEVRLFTHDPDEELGPGDGSLRGAGDVKGEGSVLKLHKDLEDLEEEDLGGLREINFHDYHGLSGIVIESEEQNNANFIKRGGTQPPSSPEKAAQEHRESTTLMVFYTSPADVPPSPKEPPAPDTDEVVPDEVPFGELPDNIKARQERYFSFVNPQPEAAPAAAPVSQPNTPGVGIDISNLLKKIQAGQQQQPTPPQTVQPPSQAPVSDLERTISMFRQHQQPQPQPPVPQPAAPSAGGTGADLSQILNMFKQLQNPALSHAQQPQTNMVPNLGAMFSQLGAQNQQGYSSYEDSERKRTRDDRQHEDVYDNQWSRSKRTKADEPKPYKYGLVACKFWAEGRCRKGENCTFRHDA